jgi:3-hydroxyanthranilate 3,4-dioxygenase
MVTVVGGPDRRTDHPDDPAEEFFYQLKGGMLGKLHDIATGEFHDVPIREGDILLLPSHMRHSPQRPQEGSIGLVIEPARPAGAPDAAEWYCFECRALAHRAEVDLESIVDDLPPICARFYADEALRTCPACGALHPGREPPAGRVRL